MNNKGFTMVEVLGVVTILVIISLFTFPIISSLTNDTTSKNKQFLDSLYQATETYLEMNYERFKNNEISYISASKLIEEGLLSNNLINPNTNKRVIDEDGVVEATRDVDNSFKYNYAINQYITINYIEDLIEILDSDDTYEGKTIILNRDLDFKKDESYKDINTSYKGSTLKLYLNTSGVTQKSSDFMGNISGNGYSIDNIYMQGDTLGLFKKIYKSNVENINLSGVIDGGDYSSGGGLLASDIGDTNINDLNINIKVPYGCATIGGVARYAAYVNIYNSSVVTDINLSKDYSAGGFFNTADSTIINNCKQDGTILGGNVAGIVESLDQGKIIDSSSNGKLSGNYVAGLVYSNSNGEIINSFSTSNISATVEAGGLVGESYSDRYDGVIKNSYYNGNISGSKVGGLAYSIETYDINTNIESSYVIANIDCVDCEVVGGLVGSFSYSNAIKNSYSLVNINYGNSTEASIGGLVGSASSISDGPSIINSYSSSTIVGTGTNTIGGLIGSSNSSTIASSYFNSSLYNGDLIGSSTSDTITNSEGLTEKDMLIESSYNGWDFTNIWNIKNNGLPTLRKGS